ncbi:hypothetical protein LT493_44190 [Streptomyces tricolor]|nr:hypothetical protein [Streptomyces tricolor]
MSIGGDLGVDHALTGPGGSAEPPDQLAFAGRAARACGGGPWSPPRRALARRMGCGRGTVSAIRFGRRFPELGTPRQPSWRPTARCPPGGGSGGCEAEPADRGTGKGLRSPHLVPVARRGGPTDAGTPC